MLTELHSVDDSLSIKTLTSFWDPNGHPVPELTSIILYLPALPSSALLSILTG